MFTYALYQVAPRDNSLVCLSRSGCFAVLKMHAHPSQAEPLFDWPPSSPLSPMHRAYQRTAVPLPADPFKDNSAEPLT
jgi:hypothetical protein